eukprot:scaffold894_cov352-Pinguiococcus_pyrenoidosus.AAC.2
MDTRDQPMPCPYDQFQYRTRRKKTDTVQSPERSAGHSERRVSLGAQIAKCRRSGERLNATQRNKIQHNTTAHQRHKMSAENPLEWPEDCGGEAEWWKHVRQTHDNNDATLDLDVKRLMAGAEEYGVYSARYLLPRNPPRVPMGDAG